jgi:[acyl-carrier-protein] S-malonyltransferase
MGAALKEAYPAAREVFDTVDEALGQDLSGLMADGPIEALTLTENAQPAIMAVSVAAMRALKAEFGVDVSAAKFVAGHSLGEYSALCAAGALSLEDAARLLRLRGQAMQRAVPVGQGAMAALLGAGIEEAQAALDAAGSAGVVSIANDNAPGQIVISGARDAVEAVLDGAKDHGIKRTMMLPVSAPFHCPLMLPAAEVMREALNDTTVNAPAVPVVPKKSAPSSSSRSPARCAGAKAWSGCKATGSRPSRRPARKCSPQCSSATSRRSRLSRSTARRNSKPSRRH